MIPRIVRYNVESEHTSPNNRPCEPRNSMSVHASPPAAASINIEWVNTVLARSCNGALSPVHGIAVDIAPGRPTRSANRPNACNPPWILTATRTCELAAEDRDTTRCNSVYLVM